MPKRFTDTDKWDDPWFYELAQVDMLFWLYLLDRCDHAGLWKANWRRVRECVGGEPNRNVFIGSRLLEVNPELYFVPKFLIFQYGPDWHRSQVPAHKSAVAILKARGLLELAIKETKPKVAEHSRNGVAA